MPRVARSRKASSGGFGLVAEEAGQDLVEYALLSALIGIAAILTLQILSATMKSVYEAQNTTVNNLWVPDPPATAK